MNYCGVTFFLCTGLCFFLALLPGNAWTQPQAPPSITVGNLNGFPCSWFCLILCVDWHANLHFFSYDTPTHPRRFHDTITDFSTSAITPFSLWYPFLLLLWMFCCCLEAVLSSFFELRGPFCLHHFCSITNPVLSIFTTLGDCQLWPAALHGFFVHVHTKVQDWWRKIHSSHATYVLLKNCTALLCVSSLPNLLCSRIGSFFA